MFIAVYEFKIKAEKDKEFQDAWTKVTDAIARHCGSLGSRLHKTDQEGIYVAYAQWPPREKYFEESSTKKFTAEENQERERMKTVTEYIKTVYLMEVVDDRFAK